MLRLLVLLLVLVLVLSLLTATPRDPPLKGLRPETVGATAPLEPP